MHICRKHKIAFLAMPKNASRTISNALKTIGGNTEGSKHHNMIPPTGDMRGFFSFAVVRNPLSRTVSKWYDIFRHLDIGDDGFRKEAFNAYVVDMRAGKKGCGYNKFYLSTQSSVLDTAQQHFNKPIKIISYENLNYDWDKLHFNPLVGKLPDKQIGKHRGSSGYGNWRSYYDDPKVIEKVVAVYSEDFDRYGYPYQI